MLQPPGCSAPGPLGRTAHARAVGERLRRRRQRRGAGTLFGLIACIAVGGLINIHLHHLCFCFMLSVQGGLRALPLRRRVEASAAALDRPAPSGPTGQGALLVAFEVPACALAFGEHLRVVGSCAELGAWDAAKAPALGWAGEAGPRTRFCLECCMVVSRLCSYRRAGQLFCSSL